MAIRRKREIIMYECIKPTQYIKEHEKDFLIFKGNRWYVSTYYGGIAEITKETFEKLEQRGMEVR